MSSDAVLAEDSSQFAPPKYFSALKRVHRNRVIPKLLESDLEETFVRGMLDIIIPIEMVACSQM